MEKEIYIFSDIHYGEAKNIDGRKLNQPAQSLINLKKILDNLKLELKNSLIVLLGDMISKNTKEKDVKHLSEIISLVKNYSSNYKCLIGNHELYNFTKHEIVKLLKIKRYFDMDFGIIKLVFLDTMHEQYELYIDKEQLSWLKNIISSSKKPIIIFSHSPLYKYDVKGNVWLESREEKSYIKNYADVCKVLNYSQNRIICISGHVHNNRLVQNNNVSHISIQSFSENITKLDNGDACQAYAKLEIFNGKLNLKVFNNYFEHNFDL